MRNLNLCDLCKFWEEIGLGHVGTCEIKAENVKWSETCPRYVKKAMKNKGKN